MADLDAGALGAELVDAAASGPLTGMDDLVRRLEVGTFFWLDLTGPSLARVPEVIAALTTPDTC